MIGSGAAPDKERGLMEAVLFYTWIMIGAGAAPVKPIIYMIGVGAAPVKECGLMETVL